MSLKHKLLAMAVADGGCRDGLIQLQHVDDDDKHGMVLTYLKNIDFCLEHNFPDNDFIRRHFSGVIGDHGIFLNDTMSTGNLPTHVLLGRSEISAHVSGFHTSRIYVKHDSVVRIHANGDAFVVVDVYDNGQAIIDAHDRAKVCVNMYSGTFEQTTTGDAVVKVNVKTNKTTEQ